MTAAPRGGVGYPIGLSCAAGINVPRRRFLPVKTTSDLLVVMSNLFTLEGGNMALNPARLYPTLPLVKLGDIHFKKARPLPSLYTHCVVIALHAGRLCSYSLVCWEAV